MNNHSGSAVIQLKCVVQVLVSEQWNRPHKARSINKFYIRIVLLRF